ncbi:MAG: ABC transporter ATP-binding protein [Verrucomicrobia bacterium]|nr:ABC transporter ATP-binding protein [Verrucomicrobiota bacterium]
MKTAIQTEGLRRVFGNSIAVADLTLSVNAGECFGLIGPNGAGKTTALRMLATLLEPSNGRIQILGYDAEDETADVRRKIGFMPDDFGIYNDLKVWEYLDYFAMAYRIPSSQRRKRAKDVVELVDLNVKEDAFVETLSRGMKQRLCLAKTLIHDPEVLFLDEPASGLDPMARIEFRELMKELVKLGKTIIISSHILTEMSDFCTSVGIIEKGKLVVAGRIDELLRRLKGSTRLHLEVISGVVELRELLDAHPKVHSHTANDLELIVEFTGNDEETAGLLRAIVTAGVGVKGFYEKRENLEDIFLKIGAHKVS